ncbi:uncharacterized protein LOC113665476 [Pocillopora damicornis]|uniref:uncharacterized protein LOC113665476 n=1 Tax=Pocillopora damicornis TaxID=46731 RepID=UPI000F558F3F|nr:uncharacterized protein LOC113665476 [Pocillopora damicornis]
MNTRLGRLMFVVVLPLFVLIAGVLLQESQARSVKSSCLRRCHRLAEKNASSKVFLSCYELCKARKVADQRGLTAPFSTKQRIRKALKAIPECSVSSPNQKVDWTPREVNVTFGQYKNTSHWYANISWTPLNETYGNWSGIVVKLAVKNAHPEVKGLNPSTCSQHPKNQTFLQVNLSSYGYLFPDIIYLRIVALPYSPKEDYSDVQSFKPPVPTSRTLVEDTTAGFLPTASTNSSKFSCVRHEFGEYEWHSKNINGRFSKRSNGEWVVNISWTPFKNASFNWTSYYIQMHIDGNVPTLQCFKLPKNQTYFIMDYATYGWKYPERIDVAVTAYPFPKHLDTYKMFHITRKKEVSIPATTASSPTSRTLEFVFSSVGGTFFLGLFALVLYRKCRKPPSSVTRETVRRAFKYHAFIIYSTTESEWVNNVLLSTLQSNGFRCCIHWKDFQPGSVFAQSIVDSVHDSYKIIAVVSESFVQKGICEFEINHAITRLMNEGDDCLIIIKYDNVDLKVHLPSLLDRSYIDLPNETDRSTWESRVVSVLQEAIIEEEASVHSEEHSNNNYEHDGNSSSDDSSQELTCYCQSRGLITTHETHSDCRS